jgi:hypothetical protein
MGAMKNTCYAGLLHDARLKHVILEHTPLEHTFLEHGRLEFLVEYT